MEVILSFIASYFASKSLDYLLKDKENIGTAIRDVYDEALKIYPNTNDIVDGDIKKMHFTSAKITKEAVVKWLFDSEYSVNDLCDELSALNNIQSFTTSDVDKFLGEIEKRSKHHTILSPIIAIKKIEDLSNDVKTILNPNLIISPEEFIAQYEQPSLRIATPLSNVFCGRESEIEDGLKKLETFEILIVTGAPGVGKTKLGIELCKRFTAKNNEYNFYCLTNFNTEDVYTAFHSIIQKQSKIIVFIDDANRVGGNYSAILHHLKMVEKGNLKIVVSVRDYALDSIFEKTYDYHCETMEISCFSDEDISNILDSNGFHFSDACKYRINQISQGNARLAMMCAKIAHETNRLDSLRNVSELFEFYFSPIYNDVIKDSGEDSLKVLGIISFFRVLNRENEETNNIIYREFEISCDRFWTVCEILNKLELVNLYENDVVKISDQILATYIHYKVFFAEKILSYKTIIHCFMDKHNYYVKDSIIPLVNSFGYEAIEPQIKQWAEPIFDEIDSSSDHSKLMLLVDSFWFFLPNKSLLYLKRWVERQDSVDEDFIFEFDDNHYAFHSVPKELEVLSSLGTKNFNYTEAALDLMFQIVLRQPCNTPFLIKALENEWMIGRFSIDHGYHLQHALIDFLTHKISNSDEKQLYSRVLIRIANSLLTTRFTDTEHHGNKLTVYSGHISSNKSYLDLRKKIWDILFSITNTHPLEFRRLMLSNSTWYDRETISIYEFDLPLIIDNINIKFSKTSFLDCYVLHRFLERYKRMKVQYDESILNTFSCHLIDVLKVFSPSEDRKDFKESLQIRREKISAYCRSYGLPQYIELLSDIHEITEAKKQLNERDGASYEHDVMNAILINIPNLYIDVSQYVQSENADISRLMNVIKEGLELPHRINWLLQVYLSISDAKFTSDFIDEVHLLLSQNSLTGVDFYPIPQIIENSKEFISVGEHWNTILKIIGDRIAQGDLLFIDCHILEDKLDLILNNEFLFNIYIQSVKNDPNGYFDLEYKIISRILEKDSSLIINYIKELYSDHYTSRCNCNFDFIWQLNNYKDIADILFDYFSTDENKYQFGRSFFEEFFGGSNIDIQKTYLLDKLKVYSDNEKVTNMIFDVVVNCLGDHICESIDTLLSLNSDIKVFGKLSLLPHSHSWSGSKIPILQAELDKLLRIKEIIQTKRPKLNYLEHIEYIDKQIRYKENDIERVRKREFARDE
jgi:hypothetical protein